MRKRLEACCLVLGLLASCDSDSPPPTGHWVADNDFLESYLRFVNESDGRILIELMHPRSNPGAPWGVYRNGDGYGDFSTMDQAKVFAEKKIGLR